MDGRYKLPQEIEAFYIIPAIRREIAKNLVQRGLSKTRIALLLGVTKSAVSQYLSKKRGGLRLSKKTKDRIKQSCSRIINNEKRIIEEINKTITFMIKNGEACDVCRKYNKNILSICSGKPKNK